MFNVLKKVTIIVLVLLVFLTSFRVDASISSDISDYLDDLPLAYASDYQSYITTNPANYPNDIVNITVTEGIDSMLSSIVTTNDTLATDDESIVTWNFSVLHSGYYNLQVVYYPTEGNGLSIQRKLLIDGSVPFEEASLISFYRLWKDSENIRTENGNEIRPTQVESPKWIDLKVYDSNKMIDGALQFYLTEGEHTLTFESIREPMEIKKVCFVPVVEDKSYQEMLSIWKASGLKEVSNVDLIKVQGENASLKSSSSIYAISDNTSSLTENYKNEKNHLYKIRLNLIGGQNYQRASDFIEWEIDVQEEGLYSLSFKYLQDIKADLASVRCLYINDEIPFKECNEIEFDYTTKFKLKTIGDKDGAYLFHLKQGINKIRLEVVLGKYKDAIVNCQELINRLNVIYREIIVVTGTSPDINVDYQLTRYIPTLMSRLESEAAAIREILEIISGNESKKTNETIALNKLYDQIVGFIENPYSISVDLSLFSSNISSLGTCLTNLMTQPLKIDYLGVHSLEHKKIKVKDNFFQKIWFEFRKLVVSFFVDYDALGSETEGDEHIEVWVLTGRDQAQVIKNLVVSDFSVKKNIGVSIKVVPSGALLPNVLVGTGPDVVIMVGNDTPAQYAFRNASYDVSTFADFEEVIADNFPESVLTNLRYNGGVYGLPETISFPVLYYRQDILEQLGLSVPNTWEELINAMLVLQNYNMDVYLGQPSNVNNTSIDNVFASLLYQNGGDFYIDNGKATSLDDETSIQTFIEWTKYYTQYGVPQKASFLNRFRAGDMPIGIDGFSLFNTLSMSAPEINGKWKMALLPGTEKEDGSIDRSTISSGSACMMVKQTKHPEASWEFMKWWVSTEIQTAYGREIESILGASARYNTANINAMKQLPWAKDEIDVLLKQYEFVKGYEQVPGGYMLPRQLNYAFRQVINNKTNPRETLLEYIDEINVELTIKRKEFGLD